LREIGVANSGAKHPYKSICLVAAPESSTLKALKVRADECGPCRRRDFRQLLGHLWTQLKELLVSGPHRVAHAAAEGLGAVGATIAFAGGAVVTAAADAPPTPKPRTPPSQRGRGRGRNRGGRTSDSAGSARGGTPQRRQPDQAIAGSVLFDWATALLIQGGPPAAEDRAKALKALASALQVASAQRRSEFAARMLRAVHQMVEHPATAVGHLPAYIALMQECVGAAKPQHVGALLPDVLDVFVAWALDPATPADVRYGLLS
jgi:hypothetical protein